MEDFSRHYQITFKDPELLRLALTHRSYLSVSGKSARESNERLEFLGDSVLGLVTSEFLYRAHPTEHEGQLTKTKSLLVSKAILSRRALAMGLGRFVFMSHSEVESGGRQRLSILADGFESVVAAIYLDQGFETAREFIHRWLLNDAREIAADKRHTNYKSHLQEYVQSTFRTHPVYRIRSEMGPDHSKQFMVEVMVGRRLMGSGKGRNKKEAEQAAARDALERANHKVVSDTPADEAPPRVFAHSRTTAVETEDDEDGHLRRRRGRRGGRVRRGAEDDVAEGSSTARVMGDEPGIEMEMEPVNTPEPRPESRGEGRIVRRPEPRESRAPRIESRPEPRVERVSVTHSQAPLASFEEDDYDDEEIGRPEGPLEERHVDPFAIEEDVAPETSESDIPTGFGRTVVGPAHRAGGSRVAQHADDAEEPEGRSFRRAPDPRSVQEQEPRVGREVRSTPPPRPALEPRRTREAAEPEAQIEAQFEPVAREMTEPVADAGPEASKVEAQAGAGGDAASQAAFGRRGRRRPR